MKYILYLMEALLAVNLLVVLHELGHMLVARWFGVRIRRFCIGMGPRLLGLRLGDTDYCVAPVPLGGYVQLDNGHRHGPGGVCMACLSPWKRMAVYFAGPAANMILVIVLFWTVLFVIGYRDAGPVVGRVDHGSPASEAGLLPGDRILAINGIPTISWTQAAMAFERSMGKPLSVVIGSPRHWEQGNGEGAQATFHAISMEMPAHGLKGAFPSGKTIRLRLGPMHAARVSLKKLVSLSKLLIHSFTGLATAKVSPSELVGPVYLFHMSAKVAGESQVSLASLMAVISACLFFFNLLPLPILDGGQILLALVECVLRRPLAHRSVKLLLRASLFWLFLLVASATLNDVGRLLIG